MKQKVMLNLDELKTYAFILFRLSKKDELAKRFFKLLSVKMLLIEYPKTRRLTTELLQNTTIVPKIRMMSGCGIHPIALDPSRT
jgi:hypothetical protein